MPLEEVLGSAQVAPEVFALHPDYRAVLVAADRLVPGPSDAASEQLLAEAEGRARALLLDTRLEDLPHVAQWRDAYRSFGARPQKTRPSVEALLRRLDGGLPRVDRLTDTYNAVSIAHVVPVGGEDLQRYVGPPHLVRATGDEPFDTVADGQPVVEHPEPGEVVWRDDLGVTCRRWNWRQGNRTRITTSTTSALFVLDGLAALGEAGLRAAAAELEESLTVLCPGVRTALRVLGPA